MRDGSKSMEQHGSKLNDQNQREEEHKNQTNGLELQVFFCDVHLERFYFSIKVLWVLTEEERKKD